MSSSRLVIVTDSGDVFVTTTVKVALPPGSGIESGNAVLSTVIVGTTSVTVTVASSVSLTGRASSSAASAVTMSVKAPASGPTAPVNENVHDPFVAARTMPTWQ